MFRNEERLVFFTCIEGKITRVLNLTQTVFPQRSTSKTSTSVQFRASVYTKSIHYADLGLLRGDGGMRLPQKYNENKDQWT